MKILITGAGSVIGTYLARSYADGGHQILAVYRTHKPIGLDYSSGIKTLKIDLAGEPLLLDPVDVIIHIDENMSLEHESAAEILRSSVLATNNLAHYGNSKNTRLVIYLSSIAVHGSITCSELCEDTKLNRPNIYGLSKYMGEMILGDHSQNYPSVIIRAPEVVGIGCFSGYIGQVVSKALLDEPIPLYNAESLFNAVTDLTELRGLIEYLFNGDNEGSRVVNLACTEPMKIKEIVNIIASMIGSKSSLSQSQQLQSPCCININRLTNELQYYPGTTKEIVERYVNSYIADQA